MSAFFSTRGATYRWRRRALVNAVSLDVAPGRVTIIIGPNGAGKSTLLRLLSGELRPTSGEILCEDIPVNRTPPWLLACKRAVMTQAAQLSFSFTVREVVRLGLDGVGRRLSEQHRQRILAQCLDAGDVLPFASRRYDTLSGGEQRRVQFARALAQLEAGRSVSGRQALLLDEPVANLDLRHQLALLDAARSAAASGVAVLIVLHDLNLAARYADTLAVMRDGELLACGAPQAVLRAEMLSKVFDVALATTGSPATGGLFVMPARWIGEDARTAQAMELRTQP